MSLFSGIMAGSCYLLIPGSDSINEYGEVVLGSPALTGPYHCYFFRPKGTMIDLQSGEHRKKDLRIMLPAGVAVEIGDTIRGNCEGYRDDYRVTSVDPAYTYDVVDHWECDLENVE